MSRHATARNRRVLGRSLGLSPSRRLVIDLLHACRHVPLIPIERRMSLAALVHARSRVSPPPSWTALLVKAFALVAARRPELRQAFVRWPRARLYEHPESVAAVIVERELAGEFAILPAQIRAPEGRSIDRIDRWLRQAQGIPVREFRSFNRALCIAGLPRPIRRLLWWIAMDWWGNQRARRIGTFGVSSTAGFGASTLFVSSPCSTTLHPGVLADDGTMPMRMTFDHRVYDGATAARALVDLEATLLGEVLVELRGMARAAA